MFRLALQAFFNGAKDPETLRLCGLTSRQPLTTRTGLWCDQGIEASATHAFHERLLVGLSFLEARLVEDRDRAVDERALHFFELFLAPFGAPIEDFFLARQERQVDLGNELS